MVHRRVQVRHEEESDIEDHSQDWSDDDDGRQDEESSVSSEREEYADKHINRNRATKEAEDENDSDNLTDSQMEDENDDVSSESDIDDVTDGDVASDLATVSFGALAKAQRSLKRKRDEPEDGSEGGDALGNRSGASNHQGSRNAARLAEAKGQLKSLSAESKSAFAESLRKARERRNKDKDSNASKSRSSKHAPTEMSSKKAVSRRRVVVDLPADTVRDPRFDRIGGPGMVDSKKIEKNYAFLDDYRDSEVKTLRQEVAKEKNPARKDELSKALQSLESKRETRKKRLDHEKILAEHKKKERDAIKQGKKPFYLKKSDQKKLVLTTQFAKMGERQRSKAIEKKRKKIASKEKKHMPWSRRTAATDD